MKTTVTLPSQMRSDASLNYLFLAVKRLFQSFLFQINLGSFLRPTPRTQFPSRLGAQKFKKDFKKNYIVILPIVTVFIIIFILVVNFFAKDSKPASVQGAQDNNARANKPLVSQTLDKTYTFTLTDAAGKPLKVKFEIPDVELRDQIVLRGQPVVAIEGRVFLIANIKIVNGSTTNVGMMTKDYLRLTVDGSSDKLAPEIHNDPVQVQAISTKLTRVGFAIDDDAKKLELQIGEINGKKDTIELHLQE